jgi:hypothetical protein
MNNVVRNVDGVLFSEILSFFPDLSFIVSHFNMILEFYEILQELIKTKQEFNFAYKTTNEIKDIFV